MKKIKYILPLIILACFCACEDEEMFKSGKGVIQVEAGFADTRTFYTSDNGTTHVAWEVGDQIGLISNTQNDLAYEAINAGQSTRFRVAPGYEILQAAEGDKVYAYYSQSDINIIEGTKIELPDLVFQRYKENAADLDFLYASAKVTGNKVSFQFKHLFTFLKITFPLELIADRGEDSALRIFSDKICPLYAYFDIEKEEMSIPYYFNHISYNLPTDEQLGNKNEITCYIPILPQEEGAQIKVQYLTNEKRSETLINKTIPAGGFKVGHIYTLYINDNESEKIYQVQKDALIAFYQATDGDHWNNHTNWCSDKPLDEWYGISCDLDGSVTTLDLSENNLSGSIPSAIEKLNKLQEINLNYNKLTGEIPSSIGKLTELQYVNLSNNRLTGHIPSEIKNLKSLESFDISSSENGNFNQISGPIPPEIGQLTQLKSFSASYNNLEGNLPEELADLPNLTYLNISYNRMSGQLSKRLLESPHWEKWQPEYFTFPQQSGYAFYTAMSTDFSKDGEVEILQTHTEGQGIKLVLMGDGFLDTEMVSGGKYETIMRKAMECFFSVEPYKSLRKYFDVVSINVSKYDGIGTETAFSTNFVGGAIIDGDVPKIEKYAAKALNTDNLDNIQVLMVLNSERSGGSTNTYNTGFSIAYCPYSDFLKIWYIIKHVDMASEAWQTNTLIMN